MKSIPDRPFLKYSPKDFKLMVNGEEIKSHSLELEEHEDKTPVTLKILGVERKGELPEEFTKEELALKINEMAREIFTELLKNGVDFTKYNLT